MKVVISNFSAPINRQMDFKSYWRQHTKPPKQKRVSLFEQEFDWGFHIYAIGVHLMDKGFADEVEFWDYTEDRRTHYLSNGVLRVTFFNEDDIAAYLERYGYPDLFINYGREGLPILKRLEGKCFRVHIPCLRSGLRNKKNFGAECYLVDAEEFLDDRSMMYIPVVNTRKIYPIECEKKRDFVYLAANYYGKRHDLIIKAARGTGVTGHFHPVTAGELDLSNTNITTSDWNQTDVLELLRTSRIAVYPADDASSPAAMWECVAAGLPIVLNENLAGGKHVVEPGVTGEFSAPDNFLGAIKYVLANLASYRPRCYFEKHWDTIETIESYLAFFRRMGWTATCS
jgi:hypothetical protein